MCGASIKNQRQREKKSGLYTVCKRHNLTGQIRPFNPHAHTFLHKTSAGGAASKVGTNKNKTITPRVRGTRTAAESPPPHPTPLFLVGFAVPPHFIATFI